MGRAETCMAWSLERAEKQEGNEGAGAKEQKWQAVCQEQALVVKGGEFRGLKTHAFLDIHIDISPKHRWMCNEFINDKTEG